MFWQYKDCVSKCNLKINDVINKLGKPTQKYWEKATSIEKLPKLLTRFGRYRVTGCFDSLEREMLVGRDGYAWLALLLLLLLLLLL